MDREGGPEGMIRGNPANKTATAASDVLAAPGKGWRYLIHDIMVTNADTATGAVVTFQDNAGSPATLWRGFAASGGGWSKHFQRPLVMAENVKLQATLSAVVAGDGVQINVSASIERMNGPQTN